MKYLSIVFLLFLVACGSSKIYVVRHAEKTVLAKDSAGMMATNPPLSEAGKVRAIVLRDELDGENLRHIFSTNTIRTFSTAGPLSEKISVPVEIYRSIDSLAALLKTMKGNVLVVGHSNTVDDIVNKISGKSEIPGDLKDSEYDNLFILEKKKGKYIFTRRKFGYPSNPE
jgi:broad specificity phosphatase PhoE